jgi:hypothetical protein
MKTITQMTTAEYFVKPLTRIDLNKITNGIIRRKIKPLYLTRYASDMQAADKQSSSTVIAGFRNNKYKPARETATKNISVPAVYEYWTNDLLIATKIVETNATSEENTDFKIPNIKNKDRDAERADITMPVLNKSPKILLNNPRIHGYSGPWNGSIVILPCRKSLA